MWLDSLETIGNEFDRLGGKHRGYILVEHVGDLKLNFLPDNRFALALAWALDQNKDGKFQLADLVEYRSTFSKESKLCASPEEANERMVGRNEVLFCQALDGSGIDHISKWVLKLVSAGEVNSLNRGSIDLIHKLLDPPITCFEFFQQLKLVESHIRECAPNDSVHVTVLRDVILPKTLKMYSKRLNLCLS